MRKSVLCFAAFVFAILLYTVPVSAAKIDVKLENVVSDNTVHIDFDTVAPMTIEDSTVVPLRKFCESAGLEVSWSDSEKTAYIKLKAVKDSALPIEQYAYRLLSKSDTKGLILTPDSVIVTMTVGDENIRLRYNYRDSENDIVSLGKDMSAVVPATVVSSGFVVAPVRSLMEAFGLWVEWYDNTVVVSIPPFDSAADELKIVPPQSFPKEEAQTDVWYGIVEEVPVVEEAPKAVTVDPGSPIPKGAVYLGNFKITHYCSCYKCCGSYGNSTAWAGAVIPGHTIAVDPKVIPKLSSVYIEGYGYRRAEDCGGAIKGNKIDVAVSSHSEAMKMGVKYKDVWLVK